MATKRINQVKITLKRHTGDFPEDKPYQITTLIGSPTVEIESEPTRHRPTVFRCGDRLSEAEAEKLCMKFDAVKITI